MEPFFRVSCDKNWEVATHVVYWLSSPKFSNLLNLVVLNLKEFDTWIPSSCNQVRHSIDLEATDVFHRCLMLAYWNWLASLLLYIPSHDSPIRACQVQHGRLSLLLLPAIHSYLGCLFPTNAHYRSWRYYCLLIWIDQWRRGCILNLDSVYHHLPVPTAYSHECLSLLY